MKTMKKIALMFMLMAATHRAFSQDSLPGNPDEIIYGRKDGMALTMIKMPPTGKPNRRAVISVLSGNWISAQRMITSAKRRAAPYAAEGYTVFLVMHSSQPKYAIPDEIADIRRAVKFIKFYGSYYDVDSSKIAITGASSGGHLSLMVALAEEQKTPISRDPIDAVSARVQAVAVFFPPTDFVNWDGVSMQTRKEMMIRARVAAAFDVKEIDPKTGLYESKRDDSSMMSFAKLYSPINYVTPNDPPVMILHGDKDPIVPLQQSETLVASLKANKVPVEFTVRPGGGHGWRDIESDEQQFVQWFNKWLN